MIRRLITAIAVTVTLACAAAPAGAMTIKPGPTPVNKATFITSYIKDGIYCAVYENEDGTVFQDCHYVATGGRLGKKQPPPIAWFKPIPLHRYGNVLVA